MTSGRAWRDWLTTAIGVWLIAAPWGLDLATSYDETLSRTGWNFVLSGAALLALSAAQLTVHRRWEESVGLVLGLWLVASPWYLGFAADILVRWTAVASGAAVMVAAAWNIVGDLRTGSRG